MSGKTYTAEDFRARKGLDGHTLAAALRIAERVMTPGSMMGPLNRALPLVVAAEIEEQIRAALTTEDQP